jgi:hypothetical protein
MRRSTMGGTNTVRLDVDVIATADAIAQRLQAGTPGTVETRHVIAAGVAMLAALANDRAISEAVSQAKENCIAGRFADAIQEAVCAGRSKTKKK